MQVCDNLLDSSIRERQRGDCLITEPALRERQPLYS